jgi:hypothetical protein
MKTILLAATALCGPARAFADLNFDATQVAPDQGIGDPLPSGWYNVQIDESEMKPTQDGTGSYLKLRFSVMDGQYANRKLWEQLNLRNNNAQTVEIAQKQLSAICHAVGVLKPAKSEELHAKPFKVKVGQKPAKDGYDAGNRIMAYKNINEQVDTAGGDAGAAAFGAGAPQAPAGFTAGAPASTPPAQPWAQGAAATAATPDAAPPAPPAPPAAPAAPAAPHDPLAAAAADGWIVHPSAAGYYYKGTEVKTNADVAAMYPAPAPAAPAAPPAPPAAPAAPAAPGAQAAPPPWAAPK